MDLREKREREKERKQKIKLIFFFCFGDKNDAPIAQRTYLHADFFFVQKN
jgi:hypothetical protein